MKYQCQTCQRKFIYPAKLTLPRGATLKVKPEAPVKGTVEFHVCPYCQSLDIVEFAEGSESHEDMSTQNLIKKRTNQRNRKRR